MRTRASIVVTLFIVAACSRDASNRLPTAPALVGTPEASATQAQAGIIESASGTGHRTLIVGGVEYWVNFAFTANKAADGSVKGQYEFRARHIPIRAHGRVTCLGVVGNAAWVGGVIDQLDGTPPNPAIGVGSPVVWRFVDNGEGAGAPPDVISGFAPQLQQGAEQAYCNDKPGFPAMLPLDVGNLQLRSR